MHVTTDTTRHRRVARLVVAGGSALVLAIGLAACGSSDDSSKATDTTTTSTTAPSQSSSGGQSSSGQSSSGGQSSGQGSGTPAGPPPTVVSFTTPDSIDCHNGNQQNFSASWQTTNATKVTIASDGAVVGTYAANGDTSLPFDCSSSHTFVLTAYSSDGQTASRSVTLEPRNVVPPSS
jgi:hypothetical protein